MARRSPLRVVLTAEERAELERLARSFIVAHRTVVRAKVILSLAAGETISATARTLGQQRGIVRKWGKRFVRKRLAGLDDEPRSGRPVRFSPRGGHAPGQAGLRAA